jgi:ankyrin repeat protein
VAIEREHQECATLLVEKGADVNKCNKLGQGPVYLAAMYGHAALLALLIEKGANVHAVATSLTAGFQSTPLSVAASNGNLKCAFLLLEKGGACIDGSPGTQNPLSSARKQGNVRAINWLLSNGANPFKDVLDDDDRYRNKDDIPRNVQLGKALITKARETFYEKQAILWMLCVKQDPKRVQKSRLKMIPSDLIRCLHSYLK